MNNNETKSSESKAKIQNTRSTIISNPLFYTFVMNMSLFTYYIVYKLTVRNIDLPLIKSNLIDDVEAFKSSMRIIILDFIELIISLNCHITLYLIELIINRIRFKYRTPLLIMAILIPLEGLIHQVYVIYNQYFCKDNVLYINWALYLTVVLTILYIISSSIAFIIPQALSIMLFILDFFDSNILQELIKQDTTDTIKHTLSFDMEKILHEFVEKYSFNIKKFFITFRSEGSFSTVLYNNGKLNQLINLDIKKVILGPDIFKFLLYHEYGHLHYNSLIFIYFALILKEIIIISYLIYNISKIRKANKQFWHKKMVRIFSEVYFINRSMEYLLGILKNYHEFLADDFSINECKDIKGMACFINDLCFKYKHKSVSLIFYPPYYNISTHPSLYHRFIRQYSKFNKDSR